MSATCCPISSYDEDGVAQKSWVSQPRARKEHACCECNRSIAKSERHELYKLVTDGSFDAYRTCLLCVEIRDHFACNGWTFGQVWKDLTDNFFPDMKAGGPCMDGLSVAAKTSLVEARLEWMLGGGEDD